MTRYASFDSSIQGAAPVTGWYDTEVFDYGSNLPDAANLLELTDAEWDNRLTGQWAVDAGALVNYTPPPPAPTADSEYAGRIAQGIAITSTATPALDATYPIDDGIFQRVGAIARDASSGIGLPNDAATVPLPDIDGTMHDFADTDAVALYKAERDLRYALAQQRDIMAGGDTPNWPPQAATIP